jgi:hypothetical protein
MHQKATVHSLVTTGSLADLTGPISSVIDRRPMLARALNFDVGETTEFGVAVLHQTGFGDANSSNSTSIYYRMKGAGLGDSLMRTGLDQSIAAQVLANGPNGMLLVHQIVGSRELCLVHAGVRSPAGKKFTKSLIDTFETAGLGIRSVEKRDVYIDF